MEKEVRGWKNRFGSWQARIQLNSPKQLAEILFDKLNLQPNARRGKAKARSTAAIFLKNYPRNIHSGEDHRVPRNCEAQNQRMWTLFRN